MPARPSPGRTVALILGALLVAGLPCGGGGIFLARRWAESAAAEMAAQAEQTRAEAEAYGAAHTQPACEVEAMRRGPETCTDLEIPCMVDAAVFLRACLEAAPAMGETCAGVPSADAPIEAGLWLAEECARRGHGGRQACSQVLQNGLIPYCDPLR